ncbi:MAG: D-alanyl-D-alanine carboxypeptidase [Clostridia bacterium]|nr:D-alanyl-D-alanine carboxypeptidase [Clostridia bacterium]
MRQRKLALALVLALVAQLFFVPLAQAQGLKVEGKGAILIEAAGGDVLFAQDEDTKWYPASVTKVMTLLLALEAVKEGRASLEDKVVTSEHAAGYGGSQVWLEPGETFTLREMLLAVAVGSANDASVAVAEHLAGSEEAFVEQMNKKARELGALNTHFVNSHGLHHPDHYTTARDTALIARYAVQHVPEILDFTRVKEYTFREKPKLILYNTNKLLWWYPGTAGLKTGTTPEAGRSLVTFAERDGLQLISVVLGVGKPRGHFTESMKLLNYGFAQYQWQPLYEAGQRLGVVPVSKGAAASVAALAEEKVGLAVPKGSKAKVEAEVELLPWIEAPVQTGQALGAVVLRRDGREVKRIPLIAATDVPRATLWQETGKVFQRLLVAGNSGKI